MRRALLPVTFPGKPGQTRPPTYEESVEDLREAFRELGRALLDTPPGHGFLWLVRKLNALGEWLDL